MIEVLDLCFKNQRLLGHQFKISLECYCVGFRIPIPSSVYENGDGAADDKREIVLGIDLDGVLKFLGVGQDSVQIFNSRMIFYLPTESCEMGSIQRNDLGSLLANLGDQIRKVPLGRIETSLAGLAKKVLVDEFSMSLVPNAPGLNIS